MRDRIAPPEAFDPETLRYYSQAAPCYRGSGPGGRNRFLDGFISKLPAGARVLDLGCGGGIDARAMLDRGLRVEAIEVSPALASGATRLLGIEVKVMRFDEIEERGVYDAVWASASLIHVPRPALPGVLRLVFDALKPGGRHLATYKSGRGEGRDSVGRYYNYPSPAELRGFYQTSGPWGITHLHDYIGGGFETGDGPWVMIEACRPAL